MKMPVVLDRYSLVARISPALLGMFVPIATLVIMLPEVVESPTTRTVLSLVTSAGGVIFLSNAARYFGKRLETHLLKSWGGWPSTILLRHRDTTIDPLTKARYHTQLQKLVPGLRLPSAAEESADVETADSAYRAATRALIELRREPDFSMLHRENESYGFRRNLRGLKPLAILGIAVSILVVGGDLLSNSALRLPISFQESVADIRTNYKDYGLLLAQLSVAIGWIFIVTKNFVREAADNYAEALFRTLPVA